jgi:Glucodextranase, domain B/PASTA domain
MERTVSQAPPPDPRDRSPLPGELPPPPYKPPQRPRRPWWKRPWVLIPAAILALFVFLAALGAVLGPTDEETASKSSSKPAKPAAKPVRLKLSSPKDGSNVKAHSVVVKGVVSPADAEVTINGKAVGTRDGEFRKRVRLDDLGDNSIPVVAKLKGHKSASFGLAINRERTAAEQAAVDERARQQRDAERQREEQREAERQREEQRRQEAEQRRREEQSAGGDIVVPNVVGKNHQFAQDTMQDSGLYSLAEEDCTGRDRLLLWDRNWVVVEQSPSAGTRVNEDKTITLCSKKIGE